MNQDDTPRPGQPCGTKRRRADVDYFFQGNAAEFATDPQAMHAVFRARRVGRDAGGVLHRAQPAVDVRQALNIARRGREDEPQARLFALGELAMSAPGAYLDSTSPRSSGGMTHSRRTSPLEARSEPMDRGRLPAIP